MPSKKPKGRPSHKTPPADKHPLEAPLQSFVDQMESLREAAPLAMFLPIAVFRKSRADISELMKKQDSSAATKRGKTFHPADLGKILSQHREFTRAREAIKLIPPSFFVYLICIYDDLVHSIVEKTISSYPDRFFSQAPGKNDTPKTISAELVLEANSLNELKELLYEQEINKLAYGHGLEPLEKLGKQLNVALRPRNELTNKLLEIVERRHCFVHFGGCATAKYASLCQALSISPQPKRGNYLDISQKYFNETIDVLMELGICLAQVVWRHTGTTKPDHISDADQWLINQSFEFLKEHKHQLAVNIINESTRNLETCQKPEDRLYLLINKILSLQGLGASQDVTKLLQTIDWGTWETASPKFGLIHAALTCDVDKATALMKKLDKNSKTFDNFLIIDVYRTWPLFKQLRETTAFTEQFKATFKEPLIQEKPPTSNQPSANKTTRGAQS